MIYCTTLTLASLLGLLIGCSPKPPEEVSYQVNLTNDTHLLVAFERQRPDSLIRIVELTSESGLNYTMTRGVTGRVETITFLDADGGLMNRTVLSPQSTVVKARSISFRSAEGSQGVLSEWYDQSNRVVFAISNAVISPGVTKLKYIGATGVILEAPKELNGTRQ